MNHLVGHVTEFVMLGQAASLRLFAEIGVPGGTGPVWFRYRKGRAVGARDMPDIRQSGIGGHRGSPKDCARNEARMNNDPEGVDP